MNDKRENGTENSSAKTPVNSSNAQYDSRHEEVEAVMPNPLVSIIMSVYNCESTLTEALNSIFNQTYTNWELVVCDDASSDGTLSVLREAIKSIDSSRVVILTNESNRRLAYSLNRCLSAASGTLIARMDGDDISEPERLELQVQYLREHPEVDLVGTAMRRFDSTGLGEVIRPRAMQPDRSMLGRTTRSPFAHATILAKKTVFEAVGNYTVSWRTARTEDLDLWYKFFAAGLVGHNIPTPLYRVREDRAAVRRRTPKVRLQGFATRIIGNWSLKYPPRAYAVATIDLMKAVVPYKVVDWERNRSRTRVDPV